MTECDNMLRHDKKSVFVETVRSVNIGIDLKKKSMYAIRNTDFPSRPNMLTVLKKQNKQKTSTVNI